VDVLNCQTMKKLFLTLALLLIVAFTTNAQKFTVKVVGVSDGDTFTAINRDSLQMRIRIYGIDAPEKSQDFGKRAKKALSDYVFGKKVTIDVQSQDGWGRYVSYVYTPDGRDVSLMMLQDGMAWHFKKYDSTEKYSKAESDARSKKLGIWSQPNPVAPWDFRKKK